MSTAALALVLAGLALLALAGLLAWRHERHLREARASLRNQIYDERAAQNGLNPERRLEARAATKAPPRAPRR